MSNLAQLRELVARQRVERLAEPAPEAARQRHRVKVDLSTVGGHIANCVFCRGRGTACAEAVHLIQATLSPALPPGTRSMFVELTVGEDSARLNVTFSGAASGHVRRTFEPLGELPERAPTAVIADAPRPREGRRDDDRRPAMVVSHCLCAEDEETLERLREVVAPASPCELPFLTR